MEGATEYIKDKTGMGSYFFTEEFMLCIIRIEIGIVHKYVVYHHT